MFKKPKPLQKPGDKEHAFNYALFILNLRLRTEGEMRKKMRDRGYKEQVIEEIITQLYTERLLDDDRFAEIFIENMKLYKQYGYYQMKKKLMEKLLPKDLIENKLEELVSPEDERLIAGRYAKKEYGDLNEIKKLPNEEKQKIMRRLLSRGFRVDCVKSLL